MKNEMNTKRMLSKFLAHQYAKEFNELFGDGLAVPSQRGTRYEVVIRGGMLGESVMSSRYDVLRCMGRI